MRIRLLLLCFVLALPVAAWAQDAQNGAPDKPAAEPKKTGSAAKGSQAPVLPPVFVPTEKISPDSVISFPADI